MRFACVLVMVAASVADAGTIVGRVTEPRGPVTDAWVSLNYGRGVHTDHDGRYRLEDVVPGDYVLVVTIEYAVFRAPKIVHVHVGEGVTVADAAFPEPEAFPIIESNTRNSFDDPDVTEAEKVLTERRYVTDIPIPGRTYEAVIGAAAGAVHDGYGTGFSGSTSLENRYVVNGVDTTELAYGNGGTSVPNEFIESVDVIDGAGPEWGGSTGAIVDVETRHGTNKLHGSVFGVLASDAWSATAKTVAVAAPTIGASSNVAYNTTFGVELGGPIVKDHLWFYAGFAPTLARTDYTRTVRSQTDCRKVLPDGTLSTCQAQNADGMPDVDPKTGLPITEVVDSQVRQAPASVYNAIGRVDLAVTPWHQGNVTLFVAPSSSTSPALVGVESTGTQTTGIVSDLSARWSSKLGDRRDLEVEAAFGWHRSLSDTGAEYAEYAHTPQHEITSTTFADLAQYGGESPAALKACTDGGPSDRYPLIENCPVNVPYLTGGPGLISHELQNRVSGRVSIGKHLGAHHVEVGLDAAAETRETGQVYSGGYFAAYDGNTYPFQAQQFIRLAPAGNTDPRFDKTCNGSSCQILDDTIGDPGTISRSQRLDWGGYVRDRWQPRRDLTIDLGLRYEEQRVRYPDDLRDTTSAINGETYGTDALTLTGNVAPRVGVAYDPTGEGRAKIFAHWGRYFEAVPLQLANEFEAPTVLQTFYTCAGTPCKNPFGISVPFGTTAVTVDPAIRAEYLDELVAGAQLEILPDLVVGATIRDRRLGRVIEDVSRDGLRTYMLANPGEGLAASIDKPIRDYDAIELTVARQLLRHLYLRASYTYSRTFGDYSGDIEYNTGQATPNTTSEYDIPTLVANRRGPLPQDRPHVLKIDGSYAYAIDNESTFIVGARIRVLSGTPEYALAGQYLYGPNESYVLPAGAFGRTPLESDVDLHVAFRHRFKRVTGDFFIDVFNLFDSQAAQSVDNSYAAPLANANPIVGGRYADLIWAKQIEFSGTETAQPLQRNVSFHQPTSFYAPLSAQVGCRISF